uniref:SFRICE_023973 n=1 Tax=Spodoptera frugiperda TaxID=7108 RepID=A0A2H1WDC2_SPOFR
MESRVRTSSQQLSMLLGDMANHGDPARPLAASLGWVRSDRLWTELTNILNAVGGGGSKTTDKRRPRLRSQRHRSLLFLPTLI